MKTEQIKALGYNPTSKSDVINTLAALGYKLDRGGDCACLARFIYNGETVPAVTLRVVEADTGLSAFNVAARRDANFAELQRLRYESRLCWIYAGRVYEA